MDGVFVCAALDSHYVVFDMGATAAPQDLFPVPEDSPPVVARVAKVMEQDLLRSSRTSF